jgi:3-methyladenine DNA glycosylase AlkC
LVPEETLTALANGTIETVNFMEQFALDLDKLVEARLPELALGPPVGHMPLKERLLHVALQLAAVHEPQALGRRVASECDTIRAIGSLAVGHAAALTPAERLELLLPFADDPHFAVREWAWIGLRDSCDERVLDLVPELAAWTGHSSERVRRFASEILRPRGVWCRHLRPLRHEPDLALPVIDRLRSDSSRYVQLSVGNWLNDASLHQGAWVVALCARWTTDDPGPATAAITRRGLRRIRSLNPAV